MIEPAQKYKEELQELYYNIWYQDKYKYYNSGCYWSPPELKEDSWNAHEFVSVDKDGNILGIITYEVDHTIPAARHFSIMSFGDDHFTFGRDVMKAIDDVFNEYNFCKLSFGVVIGNPIEQTYDKLITKYGGRIVGIAKDDVILQDHKRYDTKMYEILRRDYELHR